MKYVLQRERNGATEYLAQVYSEKYEFKVKVTTVRTEVTPIGRSLADMTLKILAQSGEYFELKEVAE